MRNDEQHTGATAPCRYSLFETAFGACGIMWTEKGVSGFQLPSGDRDADESRLRRKSGSQGASEPPPDIAATTGSLTNYFEGKPVDFSGLALDLTAVQPFHRQVLEAARKVKWGEISSYGELARGVAGDVAASRGVGQAMGKNPIPVIIPCHRVLAADGTLGGFSAPGGTATKLRLLELEGSLNKTAALAQTSFGF